MRKRQLGVLCAVVLILFCFYSLPRSSPDGPRLPEQQPTQGPKKLPDIPSSAGHFDVQDSATDKTGVEKPAKQPGVPSPAKQPGVLSPAKQPDASEIIEFTSKKFTTTKPKPVPGGAHPIWHLIKEAEREFEAVKARQSQTLDDAAAEYRRRYGLPPPPHFDKWWAFAKSKGVQLMDEFDTIHDVLTPFWGLKPSTIRARAREALGADNQLMGVQVRNGNATHIFGGTDWFQKSVIGMMQGFVEYLPDMDLAFNVNDEPRVVVPHEDLERLVHKARTVAMPAANTAKKLRNGFTQKPLGLSYNGRFDEVKHTRFDFFPHQPVWTHSRISCSPASPARILEEDEQYDDLEQYAAGDLGFVSNWTAMSDICLSPSLASTYGFFDRPNAFGVVHDLFPIFSQSKVSSYGDIIYPPPWYWAGKVPYSDEIDPPWQDKLNRLYWRGSTTGGFSRNGGWRRQHRQLLVQKLNAPDQATILVPPTSSSQDDGETKTWTPTQVPRGEFKSLVDVHFSHVGQCDPGDCRAQRAFFSLREYARQEDALGYRHVLDIDGNAFSGRFYALLRSKSLVYKWAVFREWHYEWLRPWVHFVPMSLHGEEWLEVVRFFTGGRKGGSGGGGEEESEEGKGEVKAERSVGGSGVGGGEEGLGGEEAERMALRGREWAEKVLRNDDLEVWFFRLLLEYGRVIDDDRDNIGYSG
ncbi:glycosyltransferase family 90 protein [Parathielavia appendiculata]|uniref:Glycosyltransferase family 90 protein n=1 Tax=Parathielavia appendiculata TaxID=2587402 RepID=A0AAN6U0M9_9PEZI|nr:glycosyltransferase family 90 protein [Parathielavia appendiculata]